MSLIDFNPALELAEKLITIKSTSSYAQGAEILDYVIVSLRSSANGAISARIVTPPDAAPYLIAHNHCGHPGFKLVLSGHLDTVEAGSMVNPFIPAKRNGYLYGRGAADMKAGCAAMITAFKTFFDKASSHGEVYLVLTLDEEIGSYSIAHALKHCLPRADLAIVGEPSDLGLKVSHKGSQWIKVVFQGKASHACFPENGRNAILMANGFIQEMEAYARKHFPLRRHEICGEPTISVGHIKGGTEFPNIVPDYCEISLDRRWTPNESIQIVFDDIQTSIDTCKQRYSGFRASIDKDDSQYGTIYPPLDFSDQSELLDRISAALIKSGLGNVPQSHFPCWTEGALFEAAGIPAVIFGPGDSQQAHTDTECVEYTQIVRAAHAYYHIIEEFCGF
jgi:acetylornithine deacetylase/succinyl-diaminopimelate desuccinylase-like protein